MDLASLARKYIWWQPPERALRDRHRLIAQVMNIGTHGDVEALRAALGDEEFKHTLQQARAGEFSERSWYYWHLVLGMAKPPCGSALAHKEAVMSRFPRLDILPAAQRALWPQLAEVSRDSFVLYGGTAVAVASVRSIPVVSLASSTLID